MYINRFSFLSGCLFRLPPGIWEIKIDQFIVELILYFHKKITSSICILYFKTMLYMYNMLFSMN